MDYKQQIPPPFQIHGHIFHSTYWSGSNTKLQQLFLVENPLGAIRVTILFCGFVWMGRGVVFCISRAAVIKPEVCITCREKAKCRRQTWKTGTMWDCWPRSRTLASSSTRSSPRPRGLPGWVSPLSTEWGNPSKQPKSPIVTDHIARLLSIVVCLCF